MSMLETPPAPTADRLDLLDALRGFALLLPLFHRWRTRSLVVTGLILVFVVPLAGRYGRPVNREIPASA